MSINPLNDPPHSWAKGTNLAGDDFLSIIICEAMQALKNRANLASVSIADWKAYDHNGVLMQNLGQTPGDNALEICKAWRHIYHIIQLRTALERVLSSYLIPSPSNWVKVTVSSSITDDYVISPIFMVDSDTYTLETLLNGAVGRSNYNRTAAQLRSAGYFDGEDVEEILKAIDLLTTLFEYPLVNLVAPHSVHALLSGTGDITAIVSGLTMTDATPYFEESGTGDSEITAFFTNDFLDVLSDRHSLILPTTILWSQSVSRSGPPETDWGTAKFAAYLNNTVRRIESYVVLLLPEYTTQAGWRYYNTSGTLVHEAYQEDVSEIEMSLNFEFV